MKSALAMLIAAAAALCAAPAHSANLTVVNVSAPQVNCVFNATCTITVADSTGTVPPFGPSVFLQSRTYTGQPGTPGAGTTGYEYRLDLRQATGFNECVAGMTIDFGPIKQLVYPPNQPAHVFVVTQGGLGSVGIKSAEQDGDVITFWFSTFLCAGETSFFWGMAAPTTPQAGTATLFGPGSPGFIQSAARMPQH
jgi:hypothetical protein